MILAQPSAPLLEVSDVTIRFGGVVALDRLSVTFYPGQIVALVGANGAGKSTLVSIISGAVIPDEGSLHLRGQPVRFRTPKDARAAGVETVYQGLALIETLDVKGNIFLGREPVSQPGWIGWLADGSMERRARTLLDGLGVRLDASRKIRGLSGGQRQIVAIARLVEFEAGVCILDEPTAALGVQERNAVLQVIKNFKSPDRAVIVVSHDLEDIFNVADRVVVMRNGRIVGDRPTAETSADEIVALMTFGSYAERGGEPPRG
jgi:ABC-type sugar transport system ATPase subunit